MARRYKYESLQRLDLPEGRRYVYGDQKLPSVTAVLSGTKDQSHLDAWAARIGPENAERIKNESAMVGTHMHNVIERLIACRDIPRPTSWLMTKGYEMGFRLINTYFHEIKEVWGSEVPLYYPDKYAGTTDMVAVYRGKPAIIDFKQSNKPKKREWIDDYFHQLGAYALAHDVVHGTNIDYGVILMAVQDGTVMEFSTTGREFQQYKDAWMKRVDQFYESITTSDSVSIQTRAPQDSGLSAE
jgi:genome maintenance exonuclease 1